MLHFHIPIIFIFKAHFIFPLIRVFIVHLIVFIIFKVLHIFFISYIII